MGTQRFRIRAIWSNLGNVEEFLLAAASRHTNVQRSLIPKIALPAPWIAQDEMPEVRLRQNTKDFYHRPSATVLLPLALCAYFLDHQYHRHEPCFPNLADIISFVVLEAFFGAKFLHDLRMRSCEHGYLTNPTGFTADALLWQNGVGSSATGSLNALYKRLSHAYLQNATFGNDGSRRGMGRETTRYDVDFGPRRLNLELQSLSLVFDG